MVFIINLLLNLIPFTYRNGAMQMCHNKDIFIAYISLLGL